MSEYGSLQNLHSREEGRTLIIERVFDVSRELLFQVYSSSEHLEKWWGPEGWETANYKFDFQPGGIWHYRMKCTDKAQGDYYGQESWGKGIFKEIVPGEKIVYMDMFSDEEGNIDESFPSILVTVTFEEADGKSVLKVYSEFPTEEDLQKLKGMGMIEGFASQLDRLEKYLTSFT